MLAVNRYPLTSGALPPLYPPKKEENMPSGSETRKRPHMVGVRLSDSEFAVLSRYADASEITPASYMRMQTLDIPPPRASRKPAINREMTARVLAELGKIGSNVNQIARSLNTKSGVHPEHLDEALKAISDMRTSCMEALGRKP